MFKSPFDANRNPFKEINIPDSARIVFVSDLFSSDHIGGAELTTDSIINSSPYEVFRIHAKDVNEKILSQGLTRHWIFGNFSQLNKDLIPGIIANLNYSIVEYDYKYCTYRSPEKHLEISGEPCNCHQAMHGKMVSAFYCAAKSLWWMSEKQMKIYHTMFPFLNKVKNTVLSSVFDEGFFQYASELIEKAKGKKREKWLVVGSNSWIKGVEQSVEHCKSNNLDFEIVQGLAYPDLLKKLSTAKGLVFLPNGSDTCPRLVIEAKLLGCDLILNEYVQHAEEDWFKSNDSEKMIKHLYEARDRFWDGIKSIIDYDPTISGYTTTLNCIAQNYPFESSIESLLGFCDQVVVVDGGSTDGTWERLQELKEKHECLIIHQQARDWKSTRFAVFDGLQKALARALCTGEFCWQQDSDEVVHEEDYEKVKALIKQLPKNMDLVALPVTEFWGKGEKVRIDVNPWKWRLSRNRPHITHGIPANLRRHDEEGDLYSAPGSDGCDYIRSDTYDPIPFANFYTNDLHNVRMAALSGNNEALASYQESVKGISLQLPTVYHYSWYDIERKIKTYRDYWSSHWQSLYNIEQKDLPENNMFFNKSWSNVTSKEIKSLAKKLEKEMGGWVFHQKIDFSKKTPFIKFSNTHPKAIEGWIKK